MHRNDQKKLVQFCDDQKNIRKIFILQKYIIFSENSKNIEIQNFEPPKIGLSLPIYENIKALPRLSRLAKGPAFLRAKRKTLIKLCSWIIAVCTWPVVPYAG